MMQNRSWASCTMTATACEYPAPPPIFFQLHRGWEDPPTSSDRVFFSVKIFAKIFPDFPRGQGAADFSVFQVSGGTKPPQETFFLSRRGLGGETCRGNLHGPSGETSVWPSKNLLPRPRPEAGNTNWGCLGRLGYLPRTLR